MDDTPQKQHNVTSLLANRDFLRFWGSTALTSFGGQVSMLAVPLTAVTALQASPTQMGLLVALETAPFALLSLPAGVFIDRSRKMPILLASEILIGLVLLLVPVAAWLSMLSMPLMYTVAFGLGISFVVTGTASQVFLTQLVGREHLVDALSKFTATDSAAKLTGPGVGGALIHWVSAPYAIVLDACGFFVSYFLIRRIRFREPLPVTRHDTTVWQEIREGWRVVRDNPTLWSLAVGAALWNLLFQGYQALVMIYAARELGLTAGEIGAAHMIGGLGALLAATTAKRMTSRIGIGPPILLGLGATAASWLLLATVPGHNVSAFAMFGGGLFLLDFGVTLYIINYLSLRQALTPDTLLGRMTATMRFITVAGAPLGALAAGAIGDRVGLREALAACGCACTVLCGALWFASPVRHVREPRAQDLALTTNGDPP